MRLTVFAAAAVGSAVALVGFAGAANASATIDLIWADTGTNTIGSLTSPVVTSSAITLQVILTAGPNGSAGAIVSVDYSAALGKLAVIGYAVTTSAGLPFVFTNPIDTGSRVEGINALCLCPFIGTGLQAGQSAQIGTVTFHKSVLLNGTFEIRSDADGPIDDVLDLGGSVISDMTTFNRAFLVNGDSCSCDFPIEINALRGGSPTVTVDGTKDITAKARIPKGTAVSDTTFDTTLRIDAIDGFEVIDSQSSGPIRLQVGKGGQGDKLTMNIKQCNSGTIKFVATFSGTDVICAQCDATRTITKTCNGR